MPQDHTVSILIVLSLAAVLAYRASFLKNKSLFKMTLHQIIFLFVLPSIAALLVHSYAISLSRTQRISGAFIRDGMLLNIIFLSMLFIFAGKAIHVVTKALYDRGLTGNSEAAKLNNYLHLTFSHNFLFGGLIMLATSIVLLELNHISEYSYGSWIAPVMRGLLLGGAFLGSMWNYVTPDSRNQQALGKWSDLKLVFALSWIALVVIISVSQIVDISFRNYQFLLPMISLLGIVNAVNVILLVRSLRLKHKSKSIWKEIN